ncbi:adhesion domain-containing protein [Vibrio parahaemolyticus]|uniref:InvasinE Adhesion domain-containing protein n=1 Tax=Vibrio parahaemolyticus TaxID=670 RepID=A0A024B394_VIBPH|nr:DUF823 domain-containing adhesin [Vibrio parahaemolyticus]AHZ10915.1 hypothetical protein tc_PAI_013 [Vibrio parahaemolyticus]AWG86221.1 hypothetical protein Vp2S01_A0736 [Vibrio parahaemolyticus]MBE4098971.1 hypothetical protein [Vibrio parahaemolyticus]MBE4134198.1 hypothetical protein [Vibrio parahaemolyticus]MBX5338910.1 hypothetical protein [Vibrio parahaemolyticus]
MKFNSTYFIYIMLIFSLFGCKEQEASNENTDGGSEIEAITYYAQDTLRKTSLSKTYNVDLSENVDSSDGSKPVIVSVRSLSSSPSCNVLSVNSKGFQIDARNSKSCTYEYSVGSATTLSKMRAKDASISAMSGVSLGVATATVLVGDSSELLKPISATTTVDDSVDIFIKTELAQYGDEIGVGFTLDENSLVLPNASVTGSSASASVGDDSITYTPGLGFSGVERILYSYTDGVSVLTGSIDVSVSTTVNTAPNAEYFYYLYGDGTQPVPYGETIEIDVKDYISDDDGDTLQLIDVFAYDATLSIPTDFNSNGNNFDDTVFTFSSNNPGRHSITYVVSDNKGGFATGVIELNIAGVYKKIILTSSDPVLIFAPPYTIEQAESAGIKYSEGKVGDGIDSLTGVSTATHDWDTANAICVAKGGSLPSIESMTLLYEEYVNGGLFSNHNWPVDLAYWTSSTISAGSHQEIDMKSGLGSSSLDSQVRYVSCTVDGIVDVEVLGADAITVTEGTPSITEVYQLKGTFASGVSEIIPNDQILWDTFTNPAELAKFDENVGALTSFPQSPEVTGTSTLTGCTADGICDTKIVYLQSLICGGIDSSTRFNADRACIKINTVPGTTTLVTGALSVSFYNKLESLTSPVGGKYVYYDDKEQGNYYIFQTRYDEFVSLCNRYNQIELAGRTNWSADPQGRIDYQLRDALLGAYNNPALGSGDMWERYGWPTGRVYIYGQSGSSNRSSSRVDMATGTVSSLFGSLGYGTSYSSCYSAN